LNILICSYKGEIRTHHASQNGKWGFILSAIHNIQDDVPLENIVVMWETFREMRVY
jgi:uroporphyrinogen-III decarboxylase